MSDIEPQPWNDPTPEPCVPGCILPHGHRSRHRAAGNPPEVGPLAAAYRKSVQFIHKLFGHGHRVAAYHYDATIENWVDGDTFDATARIAVDVGFHLTLTAEYRGRFRLVIADTPERGEPGWAEATAFCRETLPVGTDVRMSTYRAPDAFGRYLADVLIPGQGTTTMSSLLLRDGYAGVWK